MSFDGQMDMLMGTGRRSRPAPPVITTTVLPDADEGVAYSEQLAATGTVTSWSVVSGALPDGLTLDAGTGEISGTPTTAEEAEFTVRATGPGGSDDQALSITVNAAALEFGDGFTGSDADPFVDDDWTVELYSFGNVQRLGNRLRTANGIGGQGMNRLWHAQQIPADWETITVRCAVEFANSVFCDFGIFLCMDDPATGNFEPESGNGQNGYGTAFKRGGFNEAISRFHGGVRTSLAAADEDSLAAEGECKAVFEKLSDRVRISLYFDDVLLVTVDDTHANRKTGACYVGIGSYAPSTNYVYMDDFSVVAE